MVKPPDLFPKYRIQELWKGSQAGAPKWWSWCFHLLTTFVVFNYRNLEPRQLEPKASEIPLWAVHLGPLQWHNYLPLPLPPPALLSETPLPEPPTEPGGKKKKKNTLRP